MPEEARVRVKGHELHCQHCGAAFFAHSEASLEEPVLGGLFYNKGWWGQHVTLYACTSCGFVHFFAPAPGATHDLEEVPKREEACLSCGKPIPAEETKCPACGWTWAGADEGIKRAEDVGQ